MLRILLVSHNQDLIANIVNDAGITTTQEIITLKARRQKSSVFLVNREPQMDALLPRVIRGVGGCSIRPKEMKFLEIG